MCALLKSPFHLRVLGPLRVGTSQRLQRPFQGRAPASFNRLQQSFTKQRLAPLQHQQAMLQQQLLQSQHQQRLGPPSAGGVLAPQILQTNGGNCEDRLGQLLGDIFIGHEVGMEMNIDTILRI